MLIFPTVENCTCLLVLIPKPRRRRQLNKWRKNYSAANIDFSDRHIRTSGFRNYLSGHKVGILPVIVLLK